jgi:DNA polymerase-1
MNKAALLDKILELRHIETILSNFINVDIDDGRIYTSYSLVETGRLSSHADELGKGSHLQNVPGSNVSTEEEKQFHVNVRKMFIADEEKVLIEADKKQGEVMIVAWLANELRMKEVFKSGGDIHKRNASYIFSKSESLVSSSERYLAKRMVHAADYGMGINTMAAYCNISKSEAEVAKKKYFDAFPSILTWQQRVREEVKKTRVLVNPFGRRRVFFERMGDELFREAYAFIPQSTLVDDVNRSMNQIFYQLEPKLQLLHQGHDSLLWQIEEKWVEWVIPRIKEGCEIPFLCGGEMLKIPVEIKVGKNWGEMKEVK